MDNWPRPRRNFSLIRWDPDLDPDEGTEVEFTLTYEGSLPSTQGEPRGNQADPKAARKKTIRRDFHLQLQRLWEVNPYLKYGYPVKFDWKSQANPKAATSYHTTLAEYLAPLYRRNAYECVPLVREELGLICSVSILFLRAGAPGSVISTTGDIDNRVKTLLDALSLPKHASELAGYDSPGADEHPFFVLLEDDSLITHLSVETDQLLQPVTSPDPNAVRLIIRVKLRPYNVNPSNESFG